MKIVLLEDFSDITPQEIKEFDKIKPSDKDENGNLILDSKIEEIINNYADDKVREPLRKTIEYSLKIEGPDVKENKFLDLMDKIKFHVSQPQVKKFNQVNTMYLDGKLNLDGEYLTRSSTYNVKDDKEFLFVLNCFNVLNDPSKLSSYYKNTDAISEEALYVGGKIDGELKPIGKKDDSGDETISGVLNGWAEDGNNEVQDGEEKSYDKSSPTLNSGGYRIRDALLHTGTQEGNFMEDLRAIVNDFFGNSKCKYKPIYPKEKYLKALSILHMGVSSAKSSSELKKAMQNHISDLSKAPDDLKVNGNVVYAIFKDFSGDIEKDMRSDRYLNSFMVWSDEEGDWIPYSLENVNSSKKSVNILLNSKTVDVKSSHISIVDGALRALDTNEFKPYMV